MRKNITHTQLLRQRLSLLLVVFFCVLISSSEYLVHLNAGQGDANYTEQQQEDESSQDQNETLIHTAVDAVVPFVGVVMDQVFHLMYEIFGGEPKLALETKAFFPSSNSYFQILFEQIISANAP
jgi:hypothetical protein